MGVLTRWSMQKNSGLDIGRFVPVSIEVGIIVCVINSFEALDNKIPITSPSYYATITLEEMKNIFASSNDTQIPLLELRWKILKESGRILMELFDSSALNLVIAGDKSAARLVKLLVSTFPSMDDTFHYKERQGFY